MKQVTGGSGIYHMSVVVGYCHNNYGMLIADKRLTDYYYNILDDNYSKIFKINNNVALGITGSFDESERTKEKFQNFDGSNTLTVDDVNQILVSHIQNLPDSIQKLGNRSYILLGKSYNKHFKMISYRYDPDKHEFEQKILIPTFKNSQICASLPPMDKHLKQKYYDKIVKSVNGVTDECIINNRISDIIKEIADINTTVNKNIQTISLY